jgi:hypothetical protein
MNTVDDAIFTAIQEATRLRKRTQKKQAKQVKGSEQDIIRATVLSWFNNHRKQARTVFEEYELTEIDSLYGRILAASHKDSLRANYVADLKELADALIRLRTENIVRLSSASGAQRTAADQPPDFSTLIQDSRMRDILTSRWRECTACIAANAPLAATVMMGGLLEGLLLARVNRLTDRRPVFTAPAAPKDKAGKPLPLKEWKLQNFISVAHELRWITQTVTDIGEVLRDYRNYIHPHKQYSEKVSLNSGDAELLWVISKSIAQQVLSMSPK